MKRADVRERLFAAADREYKAFNDRITNCGTAPSIGVCVPKLRELAKQIAAEGWVAYLAEMETAEELILNREKAETAEAEMAILNQEKAETAEAEMAILNREEPTLYQEEHMLQGMLIGCAKMPQDGRVRHLNRWIPGILSWSDCDCCVSTFKFMKKDQEFWYSYVTRYLAGGREFEVRFALIALMQYFVNDAYIDRALDIFSADYGTDAPYYIKMGQAWALSVCFVRYRERTLPIFENRTLEPWVHNKAIQKCRESYRVSEEDKERLKALKL